jgi:hypothetical protein
MEESQKNKVKSLLLKGFNKEDVSKILKIDKKEIEDFSEDIKQNTFDLYSELQKDLSRLVFKEIEKDNDKRENQVILNAIKLQADLQEKKLAIYKEKADIVKVSSDWIYKRDEEIAKLKESFTEEEIAKKLKISISSVNQALDRYKLNLPGELKSLNPSVISETIGLNREDRLKILKEAYKENYTKRQVRELVNNIKNENR